jgi:DNA polymerase-3 subunit alpha
LNGCPLHNHSEYSAIDGVSKITEIADRMVEMGSPYCGLTDHGVVAGHLEFDRVFRKRDLKPIFGCELYHGVRFGEKLGQKRDQAHLIAFAMTDEGLKNLWRLNDAAAQEPRFHHVGRNSWEDLERYKEGIVFTSACDLSLVSKGIMRGDYSDLNRYMEILGDNFYIELSTYPADSLFFDKDSDEPVSPQELNEAKVALARERGIPLVYGDDGHYAFPWQFRAHDAYVAKATGQSIFTPVEDRKMYHPEGALCIKGEDEVYEALSYLPDDVISEAMANSIEIAERADAHLPGVERRMPTFIPSECPWVPEGKYSDDEADLLFFDLAEEGMERRYGGDPAPEVLEKTAFEVQTFIEANLHHYFLIAWDVMQFCDNAEDFCAVMDEFMEDNPGRPIERGPGRGSSAGCIVAYELGITDIDPLPHDLIFERFWNPGRAKGFPDIDSDFEKGLRNLVKRYIEWRYGHDRVRSIGTIGRLTPIALVDKFGPICGLTEEEVTALKRLVKLTPNIDILGPDAIGWSSKAEPGKPIYVMEPTKDYEDNDVGEQIEKWVSKQNVKRQKTIDNFLDLAETLCNRIFNYGVHASGIVISSDDLPEIAPCRFAGGKDQRIPVTQFAMDDIEALMLVKFDALGLRTLDVLADWKRQMKEVHGIEIEWSGLEWEEYPDEFWEMLWEYPAGVFQIEGGWVAHYSKAFKPKSIADLSKLNAVNRPGPKNSGAPDSIVTRRNGEEDDKFDGRKIPILTDILTETDGWFLYQENVIRYFGAIGYNQSDADVVRKILGKKQPEKWDDLYYGREDWEGKSYLTMTDKAGMDRKDAEVVWAMLKEFAKYSFNKAHTAAYGTITFRTHFAKYFGTSEAYMSFVRNVDKQKKAKQIPRFVNEARRLGISIHAPDIEFSQVSPSVHNGDVYLGFQDVKGVSPDSATYLIELREQGAPIGTPEELAEYLEGLSKERSKENARRKKENLAPLEGKSPKQRLNAGQITTLFTAGVWERMLNYPTPLRELQAREKELLSVILSDNVADVIAHNYDELQDIDDTYEEALGEYPGHDVRYHLPGVITEAEEKKQRNGRKMGRVTIEWEGEEITFSIFADQWKSHKWLFNERSVGIFTIKHTQYEDRDGNLRDGYNFERGFVLS